MWVNRGGDNQLYSYFSAQKGTGVTWCWDADPQTEIKLYVAWLINKRVCLYDAGTTTAKLDNSIDLADGFV